MTEILTDIAELELPFRRVARLRQVEFESGMKMVRLILREGNRITQIDMDADSAGALGGLLTDAAARI